MLKVRKVRAREEKLLAQRKLKMIGRATPKSVKSQNSTHTQQIICNNHRVIQGPWHFLKVYYLNPQL